MLNASQNLQRHIPNNALPGFKLFLNPFKLQLKFHINKYYSKNNFKHIFSFVNRPSAMFRFNFIKYVFLIFLTNHFITFLFSDKVLRLLKYAFKEYF